MTTRKKPRIYGRNFSSHRTALVESTEIGEGTRIWACTHVLKGAVIGRDCNIGDHCYVEGGVRIGNEVVVKNGVSLWEGVTLEDRVFVGPNVAFTNDLLPRAKVFRPDYDQTLVREGASLGANVTLVSPVSIGRHALIGAGSVVTRDVPHFGLVYGNPARLVGFVCSCGQRLPIALGENGVARCLCGKTYQKFGLELQEVDSVGRDSETGSAVTAGGKRDGPIPLVDLRAQHDELREEINAAIKDIVDRSAFVGGPYLEAFERDFAAYCGIEHCVGCGSGTDALKLALMAADIKPGEEVVTVPHTFIATVEAISLLGAYPVFVDIDGPTFNLSPAHLLQFLEDDCTRSQGPRPIHKATGRPVAAVLPVHLYGLPADLDAILAIAARYNLKVIEDACQAHGATLIWKGNEKRVGTFGESAAFSFYPGKNLGAMGDGGAAVTSELEKANAMKVWRNHGQHERYVHVDPKGWNARLDAIQCGILSVKLRKLDQWNERRRRAAEWYRERLRDDERFILPTEPAGRKHVYHLFVVRVPDRDKLQRYLADHGILTGLHYPVPLHLQPAYRSLDWKEGDFPESERAAAHGLSLPIYPHIQEQQVDRICRVLKNAPV